MTEVDERALIKRAKAGDLRARDALMVDLLPMLRGIARGLDARNVQRDDLVQVGAIACLDAIARFRAKRGVRLRAFAGALARGAMRNALRSASSRRLEPGAAVVPDRIEADHVTETMFVGEDAERVRAALDSAGLTPIERRVVCLRFGLTEEH